MSALAWQFFNGNTGSSGCDTNSNSNHPDINSCDYNVSRKPLFTQEAHRITFVSRHCRPNRHVWPIHDLILCDVLVWCLPTHYVTHVTKSGVILLLYIIAMMKILLLQMQYSQPEAAGVNDSVHLVAGVLMTATMSWWCYYNRRILYFILWHGTFPIYMNPSIVSSSNRCPMKSVLVRYHTQEAIARRNACRPYMHNPVATTTTTTTSQCAPDAPPITHTEPPAVIVAVTHPLGLDDVDSSCVPVQEEEEEDRKDDGRMPPDDPTVVIDNVLCLDSSTNWKFRLYATVEDALRAMETMMIQGDHHGDNDDTLDKKKPHQNWIPVRIPSNWTLHPNHIQDGPIYTNIKYPFPICAPPLVPRSNNPTAIYRVTVTLPPIWMIQDQQVRMQKNKQKHDGDNDDNGRRLPVAHPTDGDQYSILLHGIESAFYLFWNCNLVGFAKDSRLLHEFDITSHIVSSSGHPAAASAASSVAASTTTAATAPPRQHTLQIVVLKWCDGIYVEDQDQWYLSGTYLCSYLHR
jgi:Glycosyl hydrolases family 2, sugar binding domain